MSYGSDTALNMFPWVNVSSQTPSAGLRGTCPVQPAFSVLTSIRPGLLACSWTSCLGTGVVRLGAEVLTHSSSSPFLGSHAAPPPPGAGGNTQCLPTGSSESTSQPGLPCQMHSPSTSCSPFLSSRCHPAGSILVSRDWFLPPRTAEALVGLLACSRLSPGCRGLEKGTRAGVL